MFSECSSLKYIKLYRITEGDNKFSGTYLNSINNLIVCQDKTILDNINIKQICCYYNIEIGICQSNNYIKLYYKSDTTYLTGFNNLYRNNISFINYNNITMLDNNELTIQADSEVEIHFKPHIDDLQKFFSQEIDNNMEYLQSIDFTHFDSSMVTNINSIFYGCSSLESINLSNIDTSSITDMNSMFYGCNSLTSINIENFDTSNVKNMSCMFSECNSLKSLSLSNFITSSVIDMSKMFYNCSSLNLLDISNFDMRGINNETSKDMFENIDQLKYLNIFNVQDNNIISRSSLSKKNDLISCQKNHIIDNQITLSKCCDYNIEENICEAYTDLNTDLNADLNTDFERNNEIYNLKISMLNGNYKGENIIIVKESYSMQLS